MKKINIKLPVNNLKEEIKKVLNEVDSTSNSIEISTAIKLVHHKKILTMLLEELTPVDFFAEAKLGTNEKLHSKHTQIITVEKVQEAALKNHWALCINNGSLFNYNSQYWDVMEKDEIQSFLGHAARKLGVDKFTAMFHAYRKGLMQQFMTQAILPSPEQNNSCVLINLKNGTFEITSKESRLRGFDKMDFLTYQLNFDYNPNAKAPMFETFLNRVQPDIACQKVLAEFFASVFVKTGTLKLEKALMLYGEGANGKSVFYDLMNALLGESNVSSYSLQNLMNKNSYSLATIGNKLLNYASEISGELEADLFKQLASGEPVMARPIYGAPIRVTNYCKFAFNCNTLPKNVEHTHAYFRRFIIIPFNVTIPEKEQDKELAQKIIADGELSGIFNWVLEGLNRLLTQKGFTYCDAVQKELAKYKAESDNVKMFLDECNYEECFERYISVKNIGSEYGEFCKEFRYKPLSHGNFVKRLRSLNVRIEKRNIGLVAFIEKRMPELEKDSSPIPPLTSLSSLPENE